MDDLIVLRPGQLGIGAPLARSTEGYHLKKGCILHTGVKTGSTGEVNRGATPFAPGRPREGLRREEEVGLRYRKSSTSISVS